LSITSTPPCAVIWDMDGLIVDSEPIHAATYARTFTEFGVPMSPEGYRQAVTLAGTPMLELWARMGGDPDAWAEVLDVKSRRFMELVKQQPEPMPGVRRLLEELRAEGVPSIMATSSRLRSAEAVLDHFGIREFFIDLVTKEDVDREKPEPDGFIEAARRLSLSADVCLVLEDSPKGVLAAHRAGIRCIAVPNDSTRDGDFTLAALVLGSLEAAHIQLMRSLWLPEQSAGMSNTTSGKH